MSRSHSDFFDNFIRNNSFIYNYSITPQLNFDALMIHLKSSVNGSESLYKKFLAYEFFQKFINNNNFNYRRDLSPEHNLENLFIHLKLDDSKGQENIRRKFNESQKKQKKEIYPIIEDCFTNEKLIMEDYEVVSKVQNLESFFDYFLKKYEISLNTNRLENAKTKFNYISSYLAWNNILSRKRKVFEKDMSEKEADEYLFENFKHHNIKYDKNDSHTLDEKFQILAEKLGWRDYKNLFTRIFNLLVGEKAEEISNNWEKLKNIFIRYKLREPEKIPKIKECQNIIKRELFVNIYDFVDGNDQKFNTIHMLRNYTIKNKLFYPKKSAKGEFTLKCLLKIIITN